MQTKFRTLVLASAALAAVALASIPAMASTAKTLKVPFNFTVQGKSFPAGEYLVTRNDLGTMVEIQSKDYAHNFTWLAEATGTDPYHVALSFDVDGQDHILRSIKFGRLQSPPLVKKAKKGEDITPQLVLSGQ
ncbi:MAG: hypothetical protein ABSF53_15005 [Terracidiphilus sp.]|jgi:hypothetical protein